MQTSLDWSEIMQIHRFMEYAKASYLNLQFILLKKATTAKNIQKTIIFVNSVSDICPLIYIIVSCIKQLDYPNSCSNWIRPHHSTISNWDKDLITNAFLQSSDKNMEGSILVATNAYGTGIDNPDIKLIIQWDFPITFDAMIQWLGRAGRKSGLSIFILFTPK